MELISIIIPVHNREDLLPITLHSVLAQTYANWECIVVDDHSTDDSWAVAQRWSERDRRFLAVQLPDPRRYAPAARNHGLQFARGKFVNFLDDDDIFLPTKLESMMREFEADPSLDMVTCRHIMFRDDTFGFRRPMSFAAQPFWLDATWDCPKLGFLWGIGAPIWRRDKLASIGNWNEHVRAWQDPELNVRALAGGFHIKRVEEILYLGNHSDRNRSAFQSKDFRSPLVCSAMGIAWRQLRLRGQATQERERVLVRRLYRLMGALRGRWPMAFTWHRLALDFRLSTNTYLKGMGCLLFRRAGPARKSRWMELFPYHAPPKMHSQTDVEFDSAAAAEVLREYFGAYRTVSRIDP